MIVTAYWDCVGDLLWSSGYGFGSSQYIVQRSMSGTSTSAKSDLTGILAIDPGHFPKAQFRFNTPRSLERAR